jgi:hypothetical protein
VVPPGLNGLRGFIDSGVCDYYRRYVPVCHFKVVREPGESNFNCQTLADTFSIANANVNANAGYRAMRVADTEPAR